MAKCTGSRKEIKKIKKIKKICAKLAKNYEYSISDISSSDYESYLSSDIEWDRIRPTKQKNNNKLDHVVTNNIKIKDKYNEAVTYDPKFDNIFSLSSDSNR